MQKNVNDVSAKQLSLSDPYICYAIEQGQKWLRERAEKTKRFLGQIDKEFINTEICKHWNASFKLSKKGANVSIAAVSPGVPPITKGAPTGKDLSRKRRRNEMPIKVEPGVPRGKCSRKKAKVSKSADDIALRTQEENGTNINMQPKCIADIVVSYLYLSELRNGFKGKH
mmetsp:Transcript_10279/g.14160  ORF Transcript_10279/g.14160 Transcript_10279/m.14160 type:complete len:170 (+) Transcript_10279:647-1156(+)